MELLFILLIIVIAYLIIDYALKKQYKELESNVLKKLGFSSWNIATYFDETIVVKSRQTLEKYDDIRFFKENPEKIEKAKKILKRKKDISNTLKSFLEDNEFKSNRQYKKLTNQIMLVIKNASAYRICVKYISSAGNHLDTKEIALTKSRIIEFEKNPFLLMSKGEYNQYLKEKLKEELNKKQHDYYEQVNDVIDYANKNKELLFIKDSVSQLDALIAQLFDRTVNSIKKIKSIDSEEWDVIARLITHIKAEIDKIINKALSLNMTDF